jgi:NADH:ubiquinone oxidoreductase subunit F (NADH-binding)
METTSDGMPVHDAAGFDPHPHPPPTRARPPQGPAVRQIGPARLTRGLDRYDRIDLTAHERIHGRARPVDLDDLIEMAAATALCERDATGFPFDRKLRAVAHAAARRGARSVVVVDGTEREPGSAKDEVLLTRAPHLVLDGAELAAAALGARQIVIGVRGPAAAASVRHAIIERGITGVSRVVHLSESFLTGESGPPIRERQGRPDRMGPPGRPAVPPAAPWPPARPAGCPGPPVPYGRAAAVPGGPGPPGPGEEAGSQEVGRAAARPEKPGPGEPGPAVPRPREPGQSALPGPSACPSALSGPSVPPGRGPDASGAGDLPALLSNAETLAQLAVLASLGVRGYREVGIGPEPGTVLLTVGGSARFPAVVEIPTGAPLGHLLDLCGASIGDGVLVGGYHGNWLGRDAATAAEVSRESIAAAGGSLGGGVVMPIGRRTCPVGECAAVARQLAADAERCAPCRPGMTAIAAALSGLAAGRGGVAGPPLLGLRVGDHYGPGHALGPAGGAECHHLGGMVRFAASALDVFAGDVTAHLTRGTCGRPVLGLLPVRHAPVPAAPRPRRPGRA